MSGDTKAIAGGVAILLLCDSVGSGIYKSPWLVPEGSKVVSLDAQPCSLSPPSLPLGGFLLCGCSFTATSVFFRLCGFFLLYDAALQREEHVVGDPLDAANRRPDHDVRKIFVGYGVPTFPIVNKAVLRSKVVGHLLLAPFHDEVSVGAHDSSPALSPITCH